LAGCGVMFTAMAESPVALLRAHARYAPWNARGLAAHVTALADAAGIRPTNASARQAPSARSVRFYVANGLLDRPEGTGTSATYNYRHFLQLLAIKIRQREGATLEQIKREMKDVAGDALERRVASSLAFNNESSLVVLDSAFAAQMERTFEADLAYSKEILLPAFKARPWTERVLEAGATLLSRVL
jgi:DNA-binding transcriptional MerR regulator